MVIDSIVSGIANLHLYPDEKRFLLGKGTEASLDGLEELTREMFRPLIREIARVHGWPFRQNSFSAIELGPQLRHELMELVLASGNSVIGIGDDSAFAAEAHLMPHLRCVKDYNDFLRTQPSESVDIIYGRDSFLPYYLWRSNPAATPEDYFVEMVRVLKPHGRIILYFDEGIGTLIGHRLSKEEKDMLRMSRDKAPSELTEREFFVRFMNEAQDLGRIGLGKVLQYQHAFEKRPLDSRGFEWTKSKGTGIVEVYQKS
ncbi:hypothetical protein HYV85_06030 [Candidatus Woesearchaeota archaeon]|nr:hypothetical protein [Candidatus Woesearchaeota archaeon]